jgi:hypothetical protein
VARSVGFCAGESSSVAALASAACSRRQGAHWKGSPLRPGLAVALALATLAGTCLGAATAVAPRVASASTPGWSLSPLDVVGGPTLSSGAVLVLDVTSSHTMQLTAISPATGHRLWSAPSSPSAITAGVSYSPVAVNGTVLNLAPAGTATNPYVSIQGVNISKGALNWELRSPMLVMDAPVVCGTGADFCVAVATGPTGTSLLMLDGATGHLVRTIAGPERNMAVAQQGSPPQGGLWEVSGSRPTLAEISTSGAVLWRRSVAALFGGDKYDPNYGWDFVAKKGLNVGSVGYAPTGKRMPLGNFKTLGIAQATGRVNWQVAGDYLCGGPLQFLASDVVCDLSGVATETPQGASAFAGLALTLKGLDVSAGHTTWAFRVYNVSGLMGGSDTAFLDGTHMVVEGLRGRWLVLDTVNGGTVPAGTQQRFWCQHVLSDRLTEAQGLSNPSLRAAMPVFGTCSMNGEALPGLPQTEPANVGVKADGLFIWPSERGLQAVPEA